MNKLIYKPYLYYNLLVRHKIFKKRQTYSQFQEDLYIKNFFKNKSNGFYIDVGCFHPLMYSNTALLYNNGWSGINIDLNQTSIDLFNIARKRDKNICSALSNKYEQSEFYFDHLLSPVNTLSKEFSEISYKKITKKKYKKKNIQKFTFEQMVKKYHLKIPNIDFLNIDAEAHDFEVLEGFNLSKYTPKLICIELYDSKLELKDQKFKDYLLNYNYSWIKKIGPNGIFIYDE
ncbi:MAG: FkbM family methyltransferase [Candidatus Pelagibacter sp.]